MQDHSRDLNDRQTPPRSRLLRMSARQPEEDRPVRLLRVRDQALELIRHRAMTIDGDAASFEGSDLVIWIIGTGDTGHATEDQVRSLLVECLDRPVIDDEDALSIARTLAAVAATVAVEGERIRSHAASPWADPYVVGKSEEAMTGIDHPRSGVPVEEPFSSLVPDVVDISMNESTMRLSVFFWEGGRSSMRHPFGFFTDSIPDPVEAMRMLADIGRDPRRVAYGGSQTT